VTLPMPRADFVVFVILSGRVRDVLGLLDVDIVIPISIQGDETREEDGNMDPKI